MGAAKATVDHREIQRWVEKHGGHPATVKRTRGRDDVGMIRIDFPGFSGERSLEAITWDEWFAKFDQQKLAFLYQDGKNTNFNKLVRRDPDGVRPSDRRRGPSLTTRGGRAAARALAARGGDGAQRRASPRVASVRSGRSRSSGGSERTKLELYAEARKAGVEGASRMSKDELVRALSRRRH